MRMNRRNVLFVLGTTILLGGMLIASGAFSQVQADRSVTVETTSDSNAALGLEINSSVNESYVIDGSSNTEDATEIKFKNLNDNATIYYDTVLDITNNGDQDVTVNVNSSSSAIMVYSGSTPNSFDSTNEATLGTIQGGSDTKTLGIAVNTSRSDTEPTITIEATA